MSEYIIEFSKTGTICYTSHLDLMRIFKRVFKRTGIALAYSQGFNPHPKMGFAQPLSLGYWGMAEYFECETADEWDPEKLMGRLSEGMPEGIELKQCLRAERLTKTLAAHTVAAEYMIAIPLGASGAPGAPHADADESGDGAGACDDAGEEEKQLPQIGEADVEPDPNTDLTDPRALWHSYMELEQIEVWKRQKKKKEPKLTDIRPMIREMIFTPVVSPEMLYIDAVLDCGSGSNLSPELIISSVCRRFCISTDRSEISVMRKRILFDQPLEVLLGGSVKRK